MQPEPPASRKAPSWFERPLVPEIVPCALAALVYVATLAFGFVYDDVPQILKNPAIQNWQHLPQYFTAHVWAAIYPGSSGNYYRPFFLLWLRLSYAVLGTQSAGWHFTNLVCHVLATWLVFRITLKLAGDRLTAFVSALLFAVHPAHVENVAWISGVTDPLMACFVLGSFSAYLNFRDSRQSQQLVISLGFFALALLSKETAVVLPVMIVAFALIFPRAPDVDHAKRSGLGGACRESTPYLLLFLIYIPVRYYALHGWSHATIHIGWTEVLLTWPSVFWFYTCHLILPLRMSEFYPLDYVSHPTPASVWWPLALTAAVVIALWLLVRTLSQRDELQKSLARFALVLIVVPLLPVLDLRSLTIGDIVHDRYLYLPSIGIVLLIALAVRELGRRLPEGKRTFLPLTATVTIVLVYTVITLIEQMPWSNDIALYTRGVESAPANLTVRDNLANALLEANQPLRAIPFYLEVLARNPNFWRSNYNLGFAYYKTANLPAAENYLQRAIRIDPSDSDQYIYLALAQLQMKKLREAAENAQRAIHLGPRSRGYHFVLALIHEAAAEPARAVAELNVEIANHPDNAAALAELQKLEANPPSPQP
jgi:protein O-mannosyl-transferase